MGTCLIAGGIVLALGTASARAADFTLTSSALEDNGKLATK